MLGVAAEGEPAGVFDHELGPRAPRGVGGFFEVGDGQAGVDERGDNLAE